MSGERTGSWRAFGPTAARIAAELSVRVLGLDPGSRRTGFGVIDCCRGKLTVVAHGCLNVAAAAPTARLRILFEGLQALVSEHHPTEVAGGRGFVSPHRDRSLQLGQ